MRKKAVGKETADEGNRPSLDRSTVVQAALELLKRVGLDGLSTRSLAAELGVKSPALYWHFHNKQELLDAMADAMVSGAGMGPPHPGETWQAWLVRRAHAYRASLLAYRDSARIVTEAQALSPATIQSLNEELRAMVDLGFDPVQALRTITAITNYVDGFVLQEQSSRQTEANSPVTPESLAELFSEGKASPLLVAFAQGGSPYSEESFEYGLHALIEGCAAALHHHTLTDTTNNQSLVLGLWGVRYQVKDVQRSIDFYTQILGFKLDMKSLPAFGQVSIGILKLILSGPGASGSRPMSDDRQQEPGGWNRVVLQVKDLPARIIELKNQGVRFRNEMEAGPGGKQIQVEDPDGNPIELFEPGGR